MQKELIIIKNLGGIIERTQYACIEECKEEWPVKSCETNRIIIINEANETLIKQEKNCIFIYAEKDEILRASDAFIFKIFGI